MKELHKNRWYFLSDILRPECYGRIFYEGKSCQIVMARRGFIHESKRAAISHAKSILCAEGVLDD